MDIEIIILAGGSGSRMNSVKPKPLQRLGSHTMLEELYNTAFKVSKNISIVVGKDSKIITDLFYKKNLDANFKIQKEPNGTGDALKTGIEKNNEDSILLVLYADVPLIKEKTIKKLINIGKENICLLTTHINNPLGYGRVVKEEELAVNIVEEKEATLEEKKIKEIFTGVLCGPKKDIIKGLEQIKNNNSTGEFYLTDIVSIINSDGGKIQTLSTNYQEVMGANDKSDLEELERAYRKMKTEELLEMGIALADKTRVDIRGSIKAGKDCFIDVNVVLEGDIILGDNVVIKPNTLVKDSSIGSNTIIESFSHICNAKVGSSCQIGPYARLREGSEISNEAKVGNFVETKKTKLGKKSKANHFSYLGDANIGEETNIGAGTITCNYDGKQKNKTKIGNKSFIGTNSSLVAPVTIGSGSYVAAGSVITKDVPDGKMGISRPKQETKRTPFNKDN